MNLKIVGVFLLVIAAVVGWSVIPREPSPQPKPPEIEQPAQVAQKPSTDSFVEVAQIAPAMSGMTKETRGM